MITYTNLLSLSVLKETILLSWETLIQICYSEAKVLMNLTLEENF